MQDNIRVTTPIQNNDQIARARPTKSDLPVLNPVDPTRVNPGNTSENSQNAKNDGGFNFLLNHNSVFNKFLQQLGETPGLSQTLKKIMFDAFVLGGKETKSLVKTGTVDTLLEELASKLKMNPQEIVEALKYQNENQTKFSGKMFDMLRELMKDAHSTQEYENLLGRFLKAYNGYYSTADTLKAIVQNLKTIGNSMPKTYQTQLNEIVQKLIVSQPNSSLDLNLATLKSEIIPFLSDYIGHTNDFGKVRDTITLLINNIARLDSSSRDDIINKFVDLLDFCKFHFDLPDEKVNYIKTLFASELDNPQKPQNEMFETLTKLLTQATDSSSRSSASTKAVYRDITNALLLDNSVFMPLTHLFLPVNYQGTFMFSELWIDKDAKPKNGGERDFMSPTTKLFVTFDIKGLGYFEASIWLCDNVCDVELNYPDTLTATDRDIKNKVAQIITGNGFTLNSVLTFKGSTPKPLRMVFESLYESRRGIDVTV